MAQLDRRFYEVVIESTSMRGPEGLWHKACCADCGTYHTATAEEYKYPWLVEDDTLKFTAEMRAWNCCHAEDEPLDEFPDWPDDLQMISEEL